MTDNPADNKIDQPTRDVDVLIVGAGFAGLYALVNARRRGLRAIALEAGTDVGGTWYWNRYPGARCDVESLQYSYSFDPDIEQEWQWSERYAAQPEILAYINHVADRHDLRRDIIFNTRVTHAVYDDATARWTVRNDRGETLRAPDLIMATGNLSASRIPPITGLKTFKGDVYHTGEWPRGGVDFAGQRVAIIGTGSSGIQLIPQVAAIAAELTVFQRTANFSVPAQNAPLADDTASAWKREYPFHRERARTSASGLLIERGTKSVHEAGDAERHEIFEQRWNEGGPGIVAAFTDLMIDSAANEVLADFVRGKIDQIVDDHETADKLKPRGYPIGSKRICLDTGYYDTFNRPNVRLVDINADPIERIAANGIVLSSGEALPFDCIVFATGFDAMTGALSRIDIRGAGDTALAKAWAEGPRTYLGLMTAGFPNFFLVTGPGSPSVIGNVVLSIEFAVDWIFQTIDRKREHRHSSIDADPVAQDAWVDHVREVANRTLYPVANSWYLGANIPGKPRVFMPYVGGNKVYRDKVAEAVAEGYRGFRFAGASASARVDNKEPRA